MDELRLSLETDPAPHDRQLLEDGLYDFNQRQVGQDDGQSLTLFLRDADNAIVAGLAGWTWAGVCEVQTLWVHLDYRGQGCGRRLLQAAEEAARTRGVGFVMVSTYSFQAPGFYQKLGYEIVGRIDGFLPGQDRIYLRKRLD